MQLPESTVKISASSAHRLDRHRQFYGLGHGSLFSIEVDLLAALGYSNQRPGQNRRQLLLFLSYINFHTSLQ
jgi:hypothetical protein